MEENERIDEESSAAQDRNPQDENAGASEEDISEAKDIPDQAEYDQAELFDGPDEELMAALEAILFAMGDALEISQISKALGVRPSRIRQVAAKLEKKYEDASSGIMLQRFDTALQLSTKPQQYENLIKIAKVPKKMTLSDAVIETLSIIAYRQPITKIEIEDIRGVSCDYAINRLLEYDLIRELGRKEAPGRPILFGTTEQFLRSFGVKDISELPAIDQVQVDAFKEEAEAEINDRLGI